MIQPLCADHWDLAERVSVSSVALIQVWILITCINVYVKGLSLTKL